MNAFEGTVQRINSVAKMGFGFSESEAKVLEKPKRVLWVSFPATVAGKRVFLEGYRVQYNDALGPFKGGMRFHPQVDLEEVKALALWMALKNSLVEIPYGGAKGGIAFDPKTASPSEIQEISREFIRQTHPFLGAKRDIPAPDVYTNPQVMAWMLDEYEKISNLHEPGVITGKPLLLGGSLVRDRATALGAAFVIRESLGSKKASVAIQGFGNAGMHLAEILSSWGHKIVAVSDSKGAVLDKAGFSVSALSAHKAKSGSVVGVGKEISQEELLELEVDVLSPCALENQITGKNASRIRAKTILEVANGPVSSEADAILEKNGVNVIPDILANSGGVVVSYFEWVQNNYGRYWDEKKVSDLLERKMVSALKSVESLSKEKKRSLRTASYAIAVKRIIDAERLRGRIT